MLWFEKICQNLSISSKPNHVLIFECFKLVRNCRLIYLQYLREVVYTQIFDWKRRQNFDSRLVSKVLKIKRQPVNRPFIWKKISHLKLAPFWNLQKFFHTPSLSHFLSSHHKNKHKHKTIVPNKWKNLERKFCHMLAKKMFFCQRRFYDTRILMGFSALNLKFSKWHKLGFKHKHPLAFAFGAFKLKRLERE